MRTSGTGRCGSFPRAFARGRLTPAGRGFTLIELVLSLFALSLFVLLAVPSISALGGGALKSEGRRLASVVRFVSDEAVSTRRRIALTIDIADKTVSFDAGDGARTERFASLASVDAGPLGRLGDGQPQSRLTLVFGPEGAAADAVFRLAEGARRLDVVYGAAAGRVYLAEP